MYCIRIEIFDSLLTFLNVLFINYTHEVLFTHHSPCEWSNLLCSSRMHFAKSDRIILIRNLMVNVNDPLIEGPTSPGENKKLKCRW